jgi:hypothetical protein
MFAKFDDLRLIVAFVFLVNMYYIYMFKVGTDGLKHEELYICNNYIF